jgi:hypothetical protein
MLQNRHSPAGSPKRVVWWQVYMLCAFITSVFCQQCLNSCALSLQQSCCFTLCYEPCPVRLAAVLTPAASALPLVDCSTPQQDSRRDAMLPLCSRSRCSVLVVLSV